MRNLIGIMITTSVAVAPVKALATDKQYCDVSEASCWTEEIEVKKDSSHKVKLYCVDGNDYETPSKIRYESQLDKVDCAGYMVSYDGGWEEYKCDNNSKQHSRWVKFKIECDS